MARTLNLIHSEVIQGGVISPERKNGQFNGELHYCSKLLKIIAFYNNKYEESQKMHNPGDPGGVEDIVDYSVHYNYSPGFVLHPPYSSII